MPAVKLVLLGYPLGHTISPAMQAAALASAGLGEWEYRALEVEPGGLLDAVAALRRPDYGGANVTVPYKEAIAPLLDGLTPVAHAIGAVNTVLKQKERLLGHNTDAAGLLADLASFGVQLDRRAVLVLGAGGAARAAVAGCVGVGAHVRVLARRREQAEALSRVAPVEVFDWTPLGWLLATDDCALVINATTVGMAPQAGVSPWLSGTPFPPDAFVYDMVYNPSETRLVRQARIAGLRAATGLGMLVEQGALAFEHWTGRQADRPAMRRAAEAALKAR